MDRAAECEHAETNARVGAGEVASRGGCQDLEDHSARRVCRAGWQLSNSVTGQGGTSTHLAYHICLRAWTYAAVLCALVAAFAGAPRIAVPWFGFDNVAFINS